MEIDQELRREMIVENYEHPFHKGLKKEEGYVKANTNNESCIDNIDIELKLEDGKVVDANFDGEACAEELTIYDSVALQPNRKKCALLPKVTIEKILAKL